MGLGTDMLALVDKATALQRLASSDALLSAKDINKVCVNKSLVLSLCICNIMPVAPVVRC